MAIGTIDARYAGFTYGGESSKTYGVYIQDGGFYSAPVRDTDVIEIPGRNGAYILDHGRFKNIRLTYKAVMGATNTTDYIDGIAAVRNWLCSKKGYVRLSDEFNPNEYRMAAFVDGIDVSNLNEKSGEFDLVFECMPQKFLTSGETKTTIATSGSTISNPTKFNSRPMLEVDGYGRIGINGKEIEIISRALGRVQIKSGFTMSQDGGGPSTTFNVLGDLTGGVFNTGDSIGFGSHGSLHLTVPSYATDLQITNFSETGGIFTFATLWGWGPNTVLVNIYDIGFALGTPKTASATIDISFKQFGALHTGTFTVSLNVASDGTTTITVAQDFSSIGNEHTLYFLDGIWGVSTKSALGNPIYIDLDIGEAYKIENSVVISVNSAVSLPAELPELTPGSNTITFDNTVTTLKIVPRWWTV